MQEGRQYVEVQFDLVVNLAQMNLAAGVVKAMDWDSSTNHLRLAVLF
jgi:hypothetical protein